MRQANLRASERCALAELDLKSHLTELSRLTRHSQVASSKLPPALLVAIRVSVEDYTSSARALYPSAEELLLSIKQTVSEAVAPNDPTGRDLRPDDRRMGNRSVLRPLGTFTHRNEFKTESLRSAPE